MARINQIKCDNCEVTKQILEFHLERTNLIQILSTNTNGLDFCSLECIIAWSAKKLHGSGVSVTFTDTRRTDD